jgi:hypothetical protein
MPDTKSQDDTGAQSVPSTSATAGDPSKSEQPPEKVVGPNEADAVISDATKPESTADDNAGEPSRYSDRKATHDEFLKARHFLGEVAVGRREIPRSPAEVEADALAAGMTIEEARRASQAVRSSRATPPKLRVRIDEYTEALIILLSYQLSVPKSEVISSALRFMARQLTERSVVNQNELAVLLHAYQHALGDLAIVVMELRELAIAVADQESVILDPEAP